MVTYYTPGAWIEDFLKAMNGILTGNSGIMSKTTGLRFRAVICAEHDDCVLVELDNHREHLFFRETDPAYAARSLHNHYRRRKSWR